MAAPRCLWMTNLSCLIVFARLDIRSILQSLCGHSHDNWARDNDSQATDQLMNTLADWPFILSMLQTIRKRAYRFCGV